MEIVQIRVKGPNLDTLPQMLVDRLPHSHWYKNDRFHLISNEKHYLRSDGLIMTTVLVDLNSPLTAVIEITAGGGGKGLFTLEWNVEEKRIEQIMGFIREICQKNEWVLKGRKKKTLEAYE